MSCRPKRPNGLIRARKGDADAMPGGPRPP